MTTLTPPKPRKDGGMEGMVANWYATNTSKTLGAFTQLARRVANQLPAGGTVLEVAPGPGYFCTELARLGPYAIAGLDISHTFVTMARQKAADAGVRIDFRQGTASSMPFPDDTFDFLVCRAAFKNFGEPVRALQEMWRVLKPGGRALIIDLSRDASPESMHHHVDGLGLTAVNKIMTTLIFRLSLVKTAYTKAQFQHMVAEAAFASVDIQEVDGQFEILLTK